MTRVTRSPERSPRVAASRQTSSSESRTHQQLEFTDAQPETTALSELQDQIAFETNPEIVQRKERMALEGSSRTADLQTSRHLADNSLRGHSVTRVQASAGDTCIQRMSEPVIQKRSREKEKKDEEDKASPAQMKGGTGEPPIQMVVDDTTPLNTKIIIDDESAPDHGDTGTIIRPSNHRQNCFAVEFDNEPGVLYRVYHHEMSPVGSQSSASANVPQHQGPGIINGGGGTTRMSLDAFWDIWQSSQRDNNIREDSVAYHRDLFQRGGDADPPFFEYADIGPDGFYIRTGDGRHRLTAAKRNGLSHVYVTTPTNEVLQMAEIMGLKNTLFPDLQ